MTNGEIALQDTNSGKCDMDYLFQILGSRWNLLIIWHLSRQTLRFTELQKRLGDVHSKTITSHLRELEKCHIIKRAVFPEVPPRVEYSLVAQDSFLPVFAAIKQWGKSLQQP